MSVSTARQPIGALLIEKSGWHTPAHALPLPGSQGMPNVSSVHGAPEA
jgi:hypothetical protein